MFSYEKVLFWGRLHYLRKHRLKLVVVMEYWTCDYEVQIPQNGYCVPMPIQCAVRTGSVNEYGRKLGSKHIRSSALAPYP